MKRSWRVSAAFDFFAFGAAVWRESWRIWTGKICAAFFRCGGVLGALILSGKAGKAGETATDLMREFEARVSAAFDFSRLGRRFGGKVGGFGRASFAPHFSVAAAFWGRQIKRILRGRKKCRGGAKTRLK